jgi:alanine-synthesizing transaminase
MRSVAELCVRYGATLIVDRVFATFALEGVDTPVPRDLPCPVIELDGLSKRAGLPHAKIAWMLIHNAPELTTRLAWTNDAYLSASGPMQAALPTLWQTGVGQAIHRRVRDNLDVLSQAVATVPAITRLRVPAGWCAVLRVPRVVDDDTWVLKLAENGVRVQPGYFYDFTSDGYLVVSLLPQPSVFAMGVRILTRTCGGMV